ncbi:MAG TPA: metalloregulator ArsR/SmtB family transcription factor [Bryobacteraceae bacterium]|nr:metalloregulator ArsR/SmtB family transcription factor [Bryobacteraceae bacterium]
MLYNKWVLNVAALADPTRQRIIEILAGGELSSGQIADRFEISAPAISQHLKVLKQAHFVRARVEGQHRIYELDPAGLVELEHWLASIRQFWKSRLDQLECELRKAAGGTEKQNHRPRKKGSGHER